MSTYIVGGICSLCCHMALVLAFMHLYSILNLRLLLSILFYNFLNLVLKRQTEIVNGTSISSLYLPFFTKAIPKGLPFGLWVYVLRLCNGHALYCIQFVCEILNCEKP